MNKEFWAKKKDINELNINKLNISDVDSALSPTSENPVQNKVVYEAIQNAGSKITVDNALSPISENPVQNKVVTQTINTSNQNINILKSKVQAIEDGLNPDISADFLTSDGFGNLRYYNGHFQKYDANSDTWIDTTATPDNVYIMNITPQPMRSMSCKYNRNTNKIYIRFTEPSDTIVDNQLFCIVEKVVIRRKLGSAPIDENDGDFVTEVLRPDFGTYSNTWFIDSNVIPNIGDRYFYKAFPMSTTGFYSNSNLNVKSVICTEATIYGFKIDQNESDPESMITYLSDCENADYNPAYMDFTNDTFCYGDWANSWFIRDLKPCMLKYNGTIDYELDKNDYTKKADGTISDIANTDYKGNAMIGFPKVYWKIVDNGDDTADVYISDSKVDDDFVCWSHIDNNGNEIDYCYMPIYAGSLVNDKLRSISGLDPMIDKTRQGEIDYAKANNIGNDTIWYTEVFSDRTLINLLLLLIGKSTNTQTTFGYGRGGNNIISSGTMDTKGLFWGNQDGDSGVKVFGMEHPWGNTWRAVAGWINDHGTQKIKMTYGTSDGTAITGYNLDGSGYISITNSTISGSDRGYINKMKITQNGLIPVNTIGSASTYFCDGLHYDNSQVAYAVMGGTVNDRPLMGAFYFFLSASVSAANSTFNAALSCKPLATTI